MTDLLRKFLDIISHSIFVNTLAVFFTITFLTKVFLGAAFVTGPVENLITFGTGFLFLLLLSVCYLIYKGHNSRLAEFTISLIIGLIYVLLTIGNVVSIKRVLE